MRLTIDPNVYFPSSQVSVGFGWDPFTFPGRPRIHTAIDRAGPGVVRCPVEAERSAWIDDDAEDCSVLRLFFPGGELRLLHFIRGELDSGALAAGLAKAGLARGASIGPAGNHGLSVSSKKGGDGRHVHCSLIFEPGQYDDDLAARLGAIWNSDRSADYRSRYGAAFIAQANQRGITWMNAHIIARHDLYYNGALRFYVDPAVYGL